MSASSLQYYVIICNRKKKKKFIDLIYSYDGVCVDTMYGKGSAKAGALALALGFKTEELKVAISCIIPTNKAIELTEILKKDYDFQGKNTGIAFSVSIEALSL